MYSVVDFDPATLKGHCRVNSFPGTHVQLSDCVICHLGTSKKQLSVSLETGQGQFRLLWELANFNNFSGLPGVGAHPSCLVPSPGVIKTVEYWP